MSKRLLRIVKLTKVHQNVLLVQIRRVSKLKELMLTVLPIQILIVSLFLPMLLSNAMRARENMLFRMVNALKWLPKLTTVNFTLICKVVLSAAKDTF